MKHQRKYSEAEMKELASKGLAKLISFGTQINNVAVIGNRMYHRCTIDEDRAYHYLSDINTRTVEEKAK